jgi:hypothetical protein
MCVVGARARVASVQALLHPTGVLSLISLNRNVATDDWSRTREAPGAAMPGDYSTGIDILSASRKPVRFKRWRHGRSAKAS